MDDKTLQRIIVNICTTICILIFLSILVWGFNTSIMGGILAAIFGMPTAVCISFVVFILFLFIFGLVTGIIYALAIPLRVEVQFKQTLWFRAFVLANNSVYDI